MKVALRHQPELQDTEVLIQYPELSDKVKQIETVLLAMDKTITGKSEGVMYQLVPGEVYYIESVDKRTYIYCEKGVYEAGERLYQLEKILESSGFVRVSKNCIVNQWKLKAIRMLPNSHIEAILVNGEKVVVTRKYIADIRRVLEK